MDSYCVGGAVSSLTLARSYEPCLGMLLMGDPYPQVDLVCRGVSLSAAVWASSGDALEKLDVEPYTKAFALGDVPPCLPQDSFFQLPSTTLFVRGISASRLGNDLLSFLRGAFAATAVKLRRHKFTIKADVSISGTPCIVKLRVYRTSDEAFAVAVERRAGDAVAFAVLFASMYRHFESRGQLVDKSAQQVQLVEEQSCGGLFSPAPQEGWAVLPWDVPLIEAVC